MEIFGIPVQALVRQLMLGLVNGSFYAMLSFGLAVIFGLLNVINFAHGALYMPDAFAAWMGLTYFGLNYWVMLIAAPLIIGAFGILIEKTMLCRLYHRLDHLYGLLLTFGITLMVTLTYGFGVALAGFAGVLAAPVIQVSSLMGLNLIIVVFAVVVIEGLTRVFYPPLSATMMFILMAKVLMIRSAGLFGKEK